MIRRVTAATALAVAIGAAIAAPATALEGVKAGSGPKPASKLHRNPFERPVLAKPEPVAGAAVVQAPPPWAPELRATLVAGSGLSLANVDGEMVKKGEEYQGYTLVDVREREAVFERGGKRWVLNLD